MSSTSEICCHGIIRDLDFSEQGLLVFRRVLVVHRKLLQVDLVPEFVVLQQLVELRVTYRNSCKEHHS